MLSREMGRATVKKERAQGQPALCVQGIARRNVQKRFDEMNGEVTGVELF